MIDTGGRKIYLLGIKGSGMSSLAVFLKERGVLVRGWDTPEVFPTDEFLSSHGIPVDTDHSFVPEAWDSLICSDAYTPHHPIALSAREADMRVFTYHGYLSFLSQQTGVIAASGTHGKTTSAGCIDTILNSIAVPHGAIYGSQLQLPDGDPSSKSDELLILEACEYRNHFLSYRIDTLLITNAEWEHTDFFPSGEAVVKAFTSRATSLAEGSDLVISINGAGGRAVAETVRKERPDINLVTYGKGQGDIRYAYLAGNDPHTFRVDSLEGEFHTSLAGDGFLEDIIGAAITASVHLGSGTLSLEKALHLAGNYRGCRGRVDRAGEQHLFTLYSDYAHHPSEIRNTLTTLRLLHPGQRLIVLFYPHTVSRTLDLYEDFVTVLRDCDLLFIAPVTASARGDGEKEETVELSRKLCRDTGGRFFGDDRESFDCLVPLLNRDDVCVTMGAGNTLGMRNLLLTVKE